jgi:hypothetical protein
VVVFKIDISNVFSIDAKRQPIVSRHPNAPFANSVSLQRVKSPSGKETDLLNVSRLFDGVKNVFQLLDKIGANAAAAFQGGA